MNDIIDARGFYLILGAKVETFKRYEAYFKREAFILINVTNYTKLIYFRRIIRSKLPLLPAVFNANQTLSQNG